MISKNPIINLISTHRVPVTRNSDSVSVFLTEYYKKYIEEYKNALIPTTEYTLRTEFLDLLSSHISVLEEICSGILSIFSSYENANMQELYKQFDVLMDKLSPYLIISTPNHDYSRQLNNDFYRIRGGLVDTMERKDLFHIPMNMRQHIKSYRYSIPGYPCLYLSSSPELCWLECGMPKDFSCSTYRFDDMLDKDTLSFIDFTTHPNDLTYFIQNNDFNTQKQPPDKLIDEYALNYLIQLPLKIACSISVYDRNVSYIEEYIFPQLLLLWIRNNKLYKGILYHTCSPIKEASYYSAVNMVLPAFELENGYCKQLNNLFLVSDPKKVQKNDLFKEINKKIETLKIFLNTIDYEYRFNHYLYLHREIIAICETTIMLYEALIGDSNANLHLICQSIRTINLLSYYITDSTENLSIDDIKDCDPRLTKTEAFTKLKNLLDEYKNNIKPIIFELDSFVHYIPSHVRAEESTFNHVFPII